MVYLLLSAFFSIFNLAIFRLLPRYRGHLFSVIAWNYPTAFLMGTVLHSGQLSGLSVVRFQWLPFAVIIGSLFILNFFLIGRSTQKAGMAITSVATKMAFVVPILFSAFFYQEIWSVSKRGGIILAFLAVGATLKKRGDKKGFTSSGSFLGLPLLLFILLGITDTLIKYTEGQYLDEGDAPLFTAVLFGTSALVGFLIVLFDPTLRKEIKNPSNIFWGVLLGFGNFFCLYFFVLALKSQFIAASSIFAMTNALVVVGSTLIGRIFFRESFHVVQIGGILLALLAIGFLSWG